MIKEDTICAIATASGTGAIAVIRLSGSEALEICDKVFVAPKKDKKLSTEKANTVHYGTILNNESIIDDVLVSIFKNPHSYTGENIAEISCHGSCYIQRQILQLLVDNGARLAEPGEFTLRAFLNGKMDLSQAEGVADLIASSSKASHQLAIQQIRGGFSAEIQKLRSELLKFISLIELELDFSEEDVKFADRKLLKELVTLIHKLIEKLVDSFSLGNVIKAGIPVAIIGEPNVGKSTLLNILLNEDKAIVSEIAGTTRDVIEDAIVINGISFRFIDTAGLRETTDVIEILGINKTLEKIDQAAIIILVADAMDSTNTINTRIKEIKNRITDEKQLIVVINKIDKLEYVDNSEINSFSEIDCEEKYIIQISAKLDKNIDTLKDVLLNTINFTHLQHNDVIVTNVRHYEALSKALTAIKRVLEGLDNEISGDFLAQDIREVLHYLGEITGEITNDEVLGNIFSQFCIGK